MLFRSIATLISATCLIFLVFTDLDLTQRLLLIGVVLPEVIASWMPWLRR